MDFSVIANVVMGFLGQYPFVMKLIVFMGTVRLFAKPLMLAIQTYVDGTPTTKDNEIWEKIKGNVVYKIFAWILDYVASVKLPEAKK